MISAESSIGVQLPTSAGSTPSASSWLLEILQSAANEFRDVFNNWRPQLFRKWQLIDLVTTFETRRGTSGHQVEIAKFVNDRVQQSLVYRSRDKASSLEEAFSLRAEPLQLDGRRSSNPKVRFRMGLDHGAHHYEGCDELPNLIAELSRAKVLTVEAAAALEWAMARACDWGSVYEDLKAKKFVLLGATAELSPISALLAAGADVLTDHPQASIEEKIKLDLGNDADRYPGCFQCVKGIRDRLDLLADPVRFAETVIQFSEGKPVNFGMFAYKGGEGRELRLAAAMESIVRKVESARLLGSITYFLSPSVTTEVSSATAEISNRRFQDSHAERLIGWLTLNRFFSRNMVEAGGRYWTRSILPRQGASYIAANLFGKNYAAEVRSRSTIISANVAPITATRSIEKPETRLALSHAQQFGIEIFRPETTRKLMFLLMLHDLLKPSTPQKGPFFAKQLHGGVFTNPWTLDSVMRLAHLRGKLSQMAS